MAGIDGWRISGDFIGEEIIIEAKHVKGRIRSMPSFEEVAVG